MSRGATGLTVAWILSCLPIALPALWEPCALSLGDASRLALAALPWIAWLGLPFPAGENRVERGWSSALLAAPPMAAGFAIDRGRGDLLPSLALVAAASLAMILLLAGAAQRAARERRTAVVHALAWIALVPGLPLLRSALELGGASAYGSAPRWLAWLAGASPLAWVWNRARTHAVAEGGSAVPWAALSVCLALWALSGLAPRRPTAHLGEESAP